MRAGRAGGEGTTPERVVVRCPIHLESIRVQRGAHQPTTRCPSSGSEFPPSGSDDGRDVLAMTSVMMPRTRTGCARREMFRTVNDEDARAAAAARAPRTCHHRRHRARYCRDRSLRLRPDGRGTQKCTCAIGERSVRRVDQERDRFQFDTHSPYSEYEWDTARTSSLVSPKC